MAKIERYLFRNLQSWADTSDWIVLDYEALNVIIGRNETGKSVFFKILAQMLVPSMFGKLRRDLVRDGADRGDAVFHLDTGTFIAFTVYQNNTQYYQIQFPVGHPKYPEGHLIQTVTDDPPPELLEELGWFVDPKEKIILNLLTKDMNLPFIQTTPRWNASALRFISHHERLDAIQERLESGLKRIGDALSKGATRLDSLQYMYDRIPRTDVEKSRLLLAEGTALQSVWTDFDKLLAAAQQVAELPALPVSEISAESTTAFLQCFKELIGLDRLFQDQIAALNSLPPERDYDFMPELKALASLEPQTALLMQGVAKLFSAITQMPAETDYGFLEEFEALSCLSSATDVCARECARLFLALQAIPEQKTYPVAEMFALVDLSGTLTLLLETVSTALRSVDACATLEETCRENARKITELEKELGICPTCGRAFDESHTCA